MASPLRVVMISNVLSHDGIPHAGGQYLRRLVCEVEGFADLTLIVPNHPATRAAAEREGTPQAFVVAGQHRSGTIRGRAMSRLAAVADAKIRRLDPGLPSLPLALALVRDRSLRRLIAEADVIDLQWSECIRLAPLVRRINRRARLLATFHDVQSQLFAREGAGAAGRARYWRAVAAHSRRSERAAVRRVDEIIVFSEKDSHLLGDSPSARVVRPPLAPEEVVPHRPSGTTEPTVLFVSHLSRPENDEGVRWFLDQVWDDVARELPAAHCRLVGAGASDALVEFAQRFPRVTLAGFVPDLDAEYAAARVCVVPLHFGAGVKFKTVEALTRGVPVLTTPVGAEGIGGADLFALLSDDAHAWKTRLRELLSQPEGAHASAEQAQQWAHAAYGQEAFTREIRAAYGIGPRAR